MKKLSTKISVFFILFVGVLTTVTNISHADNRKILKPEPEYQEIARRVAYIFPAKHLLQEPMDDEIAGRAWTNYLSQLDYSHMYFTQEDIDGFRRYEKEIDNMLIEGDISFAYDVFDLFMQRVDERCEFIKKVLNEDFDLNKDEFLELRKDDSPWPRNRKEQDDLWRKQIKSEYIRQLIADEQAKAAMTNASVSAASSNEVTTADSATNIISVVSNSLAVAVTNTITSNSNAVTVVTNQISEVSTNNVTSSNNVATAIKPEILTPKEKILKRYQQMQTVLHDSDSDWVLQKYLSAFARAYDPHSDYMTDNSSEDFDIEMSLSLVGIGALLRSEDGAAKVVRLIPGGPAARDTSPNKLQPGDKIIAVAQGDEPAVDIRHRPLDKIVRFIRGKKGTKVVLTVIPATDPMGTTTKTVTLIRDEVKLDQQAASSKVKTYTGADGVTHRIGIIDLPAFYANMHARSINDPEYRSASYDVSKEIKKLKDDNVEGIILDLRNDGGGSLLEAIKMVGLFIRKGPVVMVKDRRGLFPLPDKDPTVAYSGPLMVMVNRLSASASEIVTAALQDYGRAIVMGDSKTHGKGTVQTVLPLGFQKSLGKVKVTTAAYYRITGKSTQLQGVTPDIIMSSGYDFMDLGEGELPYAMQCLPVRGALYNKIADLSKIIPVLNEKLQARLAGEDQKRYDAYKKMLARIKKLNSNKKISLNIEKRREMAESDKELNELQKKLMPDEEEETIDGKKDDNSDIVLDEAVKVMCDFIKYPEAKLPPAPANSNMISWPRLIEQMLQNM